MPGAGQVLIQDHDSVGRRQVATFLEQIDLGFPDACTISIIWDNWSIHQHEEVKAQLARLPRLEVVCLPTYAPWRGPTQKLWRTFRQEVLYLHRFADHWEPFRQRIRAYFAQCAAGSPDVLRYVGLTGSGMLATALHGP